MLGGLDWTLGLIPVHLRMHGRVVGTVLEAEVHGGIRPASGNLDAHALGLRPGSMDRAQVIGPVEGAGPTVLGFHGGHHLANQRGVHEGRKLVGGFGEMVVVFPIADIQLAGAVELAVHGIGVAEILVADPDGRQTGLQQNRAKFLTRRAFERHAEQGQILRGVSRHGELRGGRNRNRKNYVLDVFAIHGNACVPGEWYGIRGSPMDASDPCRHPSIPPQCRGSRLT